jgi:hypothetical protein
LAYCRLHRGGPEGCIGTDGVAWLAGEG